MSKPSLPQGTRDFGPDVVRKRNYILNTIRNVFELYGFQPLETPAMENIDTLLGKYGEEGDKLIFKILDNSDFLKRIPNRNKKFLETPQIRDTLKELIPELENIKSELKKVDWDKTIDELLSELQNYFNDKTLGDIIGETKPYANEFSDKALKYDLTIPFARYVAMNHNKLTFPFKRYQIQPVWRADRPQRGRYREFYQCDADVVGSYSLLNEVELIFIIDQVYSNLSKHFGENDENKVTICINNRKIWAGVAELCGCPDRITDITVALDKFDKIGKPGVKQELIQKGFNEAQTDRIFDCLFPEESVGYYLPIDINELNEFLSEFSKIETETILNSLINHKDLFVIIDCLIQNFKENNISIGISGVKELLQVINPFIKKSNTSFISSTITIETTLARGLNYYTGTIIEVKAPSNVKIGSIGGGGRYDDLTGLFGVPNIPGVGISFGVDRIYDVMEELKLFPDEIHVGTQVLFFNLGVAESETAFNLMQQLRNKGVRCELFHEHSKFDKQFKYAEKKNIPFIIIIGEKELTEKTCTIKTLSTGEQETISTNNLLSYTF
jgi:histidyl-tRNA synthetase